MMKSLSSGIILLICLFIPQYMMSQTTDFDIDQYVKFLEQHQNMSPAQLLEMHPAGVFNRDVNTFWESALYHDSIEIKYNLTDYEKTVLNKYGFVVTERLQKGGFGIQFLDIWEKDLPVFISTDAILHAFHLFYDKMLIQMESGILIDRITDFLLQLHSTLPDLATKYADNPSMDQMLRDVDIYLSVPLLLLDQTINPVYAENLTEINTILNLIDAEEFASYPFFSETCKEIDFSQFKPRGHYEENGPSAGEDPRLPKYFRAMIWLGRIEIYLLKPESIVSLSCPLQTDDDIQRQVIVALLISELIELSGTDQSYAEIEELLEFFIGEQDNVTLPHLQSLTQSLAISSASDLLDENTFRTFQDSLKTKDYAAQKILSQVLISDPFSPGSIEPASAFMLFGQRFVIDSYVSGSVVFDRIVYNQTKICRLFPSTLDILFALGNNASLQLLTNELDSYHYSSNLAGLRYLIDEYEDDFWTGSIYNMWLNAIRQINPPDDRNDFPPFMQTGAWWQQKMNTQLASWTELRHDNLLYAKQSYTGGAVCFYPYGYVEPFPEFYRSFKILAEQVQHRFSGLAFSNDYIKNSFLDYFELLYGVADTLESIAIKELAGTPIEEEELIFMRRMIYDIWNCVPTFDGWYLRLCKGADWIGQSVEELDRKDYIVADYHTTPTDCGGTMMGWVSHAGTGMVDMAIVTAKDAEGRMIAYVGPVSSYHHYVTTDFLRLTDSEWKETYLSASTRPDWVNIYLADPAGETRGGGGSLVVNLDDRSKERPTLPSTHLTAINYPNPFNATTIINFVIPSGLKDTYTELTIYDIQGKIIKIMINRDLPPGNYLTRWDATDAQNQSVASGIYFYVLKVGDLKFSGKMNLIK